MGGPIGAVVRRAGRTRAFAAVASRLLPPLDRALRGAPTRLAGFPYLTLVTTSRRGGGARTTPLLHARSPDGAPVVAASNWGKPRLPGWARDLDADPRALADGRPVVARRAAPEEAALLWPLLEAFWPAYRDYRRRAGREVPLYVLESDESGIAGSGGSPR